MPSAADETVLQIIHESAAMSARKSPLYTVFGMIVGLVVLAGGAAKFYRGISGLGEEQYRPSSEQFVR